jgi:CRISPR-associated protein Cas1
MNSDDTLYGRIKNRVLTISGNNASIRVDGGCLVVSDGPVHVPAGHSGRAVPVKDRMVTCRLRRADCPVDRIVVTRPDGFITFGAIKWLHGVGAGLVQLDWDGKVLLTNGPAGTDQPALRRAQVLAAGNEIGYAITREILRIKLNGQATVARLLGSQETAELILKLANELDNASDAVRLLAVEAMAATAYWPLWAVIPLRFARRDHVPEHWLTFGGRHSPMSGKPLKAATPGNAILNYLYAVVVSEVTIALTGAGLDPGLGVFHADRDRRASLAYDAVEPIRPYVDSWVTFWLSTARFSKRDFHEEADGTVRLTRPPTSHLAMTAAIWRSPAQAVAGWLARALAGSLVERRMPAPFPALPAPKRTWQGLDPPVAKTCHECGKALAPRQRKFCSEACAISFHVATTTAAELPARPASGSADAPSDAEPSNRGGGAKNRRHLALRRTWDAEHAPAAQARPRRRRNSWTKASGPAVDQLRDWFTAAVAPRVATCPAAEIRRATGLSVRYAIMIRQGYVPHPRHFLALAKLAGVSAPKALRLTSLRPEAMAPSVGFQP